MSSIITNNSAMNALSIMKSVNKNLADTQERISTGLAVRSSKDNAAYFSISQTMKGDSGMLKAIDEGLTVTRNVVATGRLGAETFAGLAKDVTERLAFAQGTGVDLGKVQAEVTELASRMQTVIDQSTFNGVSMVDGTTTSAATTPDAGDVISVVTGVARSDATTMTATSINIQKVNLQDIQAFVAGLDLEASTDLAGDLEAMEDQLALSNDAATKLGITEKSIETQQEFLGELTKRLDSGVGSIIDADMEEEAARLQALQVQQQLATQSLSIANQGPQNIMALFR
jgi:flagellin